MEEERSGGEGRPREDARGGGGERPAPRYEANLSVEMVADIRISLRSLRRDRADIKRASVKSLSSPLSVVR